MDDIVKEFLVESFESLDRLDQDFVALESDPSNTEILNAIFRTIHTIKGTCGFLSFSKLEKITHVGETLLDSLRAGRCTYTTDTASALLQLVDATRAILENIEASGGEGDETYSELAATLTALSESNKESTSSEAAKATEQADKPTSDNETPSQQKIEPDGEVSTSAESTSDSKEYDTNQIEQTADSAEVVAKNSEPDPSSDLSEKASQATNDAAMPTDTEKEQEKEGEQESQQLNASAEPADVAAEQVQELLNELDESLEKHRSGETPAEETQAATEQVDPDELLSAFAEGASDEAISALKEQASEEVEDVANYDLIAEIMGSPDFQDVLDQDIAATKQKATGPQAEETKIEEETTELTTEAKASEDIPKKVEEVESSTPPVVTEAAAPPQEAKEIVKEDNTMTESSEPTTVTREPAAQGSSAQASSSSRPSLADTSLRVDVALLDEVMNLVGELVLARNQILQFTKSHTDSSFVNTCQRLNLITSELQEGVMKTRMQPIHNVWNKFPRVVRDVAKACGKDIVIEMEGKDTELDKTILEAIKDPLTHIVRNSADHGIEDPDTREGKGKSRQGTLLLRAYHEGGHVIIEISDDGAGLNTDRIKAKAVEKGIITPEQASRLSEQDIQRLIFKPGFSTAEKVTNVSGRGVGMDVVRSNIEKIGGQVDIQSQLDKGTTLSIKIPLTLAIVPALIVTCEEQRFAIPQVNLLELLRIEEDDVATKIEEIKGSFFYRLRGNLLPLVYLSRELETQITQNGETSSSGEVSIVVVKAEEKEFGLVVEKVHDTEEIVVKPLGRQLKDIQVFSGATIMGDGKVALILDVFGLAKKANVVQDLLDNGADEHLENVAVEASERQSLLLVSIGSEGRLAIPLSMVNRLEEFPIKDIEIASGREVVQYRGGILPLVDLPSFFAQENDQKSTSHSYTPDHKAVVVYSEGQRFVGLIVDRILDIVDENVEVSYDQGREGIQGSAVIQNKVTDLLDIHEVLRVKEPGFFKQESSAEMGA